MHILHDAEIPKLNYRNFLELGSVVDILLRILTLYSSCNTNSPFKRYFQDIISTPSHSEG